MSLIERLGDDYQNLPDILDEYERGLGLVEQNLNIKGKSLQAANVEQPSWQLYYDTRRSELYSLVKYFEAKMSATRGKLYKKYTEKYTRELSERGKDKYIDNEETFLSQNEIYLEIKETYEKYVAVCDAFRARGYALNNITKIRVASLEDVLI